MAIRKIQQIQMNSGKKINKKSSVQVPFNNALKHDSVMFTGKEHGKTIIEADNILFSVNVGSDVILEKGKKNFSNIILIDNLKARNNFKTESRLFIEGDVKIGNNAKLQEIKQGNNTKSFTVGNNFNATMIEISGKSEIGNNSNIRILESEKNLVVGNNAKIKNTFGEGVLYFKDNMKGESIRISNGNLTLGKNSEINVLTLSNTTANIGNGAEIHQINALHKNKHIRIGNNAGIDDIGIGGGVLELKALKRLDKLEFLSYSKNPESIPQIILNSPKIPDKIKLDYGEFKKVIIQTFDKKFDLFKTFDFGDKTKEEVAKVVEVKIVKLNLFNKLLKVLRYR